MNEALPIAAIISSVASMFLCVSIWGWLRGKGTNGDNGTGEDNE